MWISASICHIVGKAIQGKVCVFVTLGFHCTDPQLNTPRKLGHNIKYPSRQRPTFKKEFDFEMLEKTCLSTARFAWYWQPATPVCNAKRSPQHGGRFQLCVNSALVGEAGYNDSLIQSDPDEVRYVRCCCGAASVVHPSSVTVSYKTASSPSVFNGF